MRALVENPNTDIRFIDRDGLMAEHLYEYKWPPESRADWYMIQEQVSEFLGVKSFKRKYPGKVKKLVHF